MAGPVGAGGGPAPPPPPAPAALTPNPTPPQPPHPTSPPLLPTRVPPTPLPTTLPTAVPRTPTPVPTIPPTLAPTATAPAQAEVEPPPLASLAVMIENQADARPQTGLTRADVVYEALAEGGISRFVALFLTQDADVVGPVRSLRHYFAFLAADYGADMIHIGASPEGFAWRDAMNMGYLDESKGDP